MKNYSEKEDEVKKSMFKKRKLEDGEGDVVMGSDELQNSSKRKRENAND